MLVKTKKNYREEKQMIESLERKQILKKLKETKNDTVVRCKKCGRTQYLLFRNGVKNGWSKCCDGYTMPIILTTVNIREEIDKVFAPLKAIIEEAMNGQ